MTDTGSLRQTAKGRDKLLGHVAMLVYAALIAGSFSLGALAAPHLDPAALNAIRFVIASALVGAVLVMLSGRLPSLPEAPWRFAVVGALMGTYFVLMFVALKLTDPVSTGAVYTLTPMMAAIFGYFILAQISRPVVVVSLLVAAAGAVVVIFRGDFQAMLAFDIGRGELIFLFGCACQAAYAPLVKRFNRGETTLEFTLWTFIACTIWITVFAVPQSLATDWLALPAIVWICIAYVSVVATALSLFLLLYASMRLPASKVFAYGYLTPSFVIVLEGLIGHGWATPSIAFGAIITVFGLVVLALAPDG